MRHDWSSLRVPLVYPAVLFTVYCGAQVMNTSTNSPLVALAGLRSWIVWIPVAFIAYQTIRRPRQVHQVVMLLLFLSLITGAYGIYQYRAGFGHLYELGPGFAFYNRFGWDEESVRATSTFVSPGAFGAAMSLAVIIALGAAAHLRGWFGKGVALLTGATCLVGLGTSASRAPLLGLVVGGLGILLLVRKPRLIVAAPSLSPA